MRWRGGWRASLHPSSSSWSSASWIGADGMGTSVGSRRPCCASRIFCTFSFGSDGGYRRSRHE